MSILKELHEQAEHDRQVKIARNFLNSGELYQLYEQQKLTEHLRANELLSDKEMEEIFNVFTFIK